MKRTRELLDLLGIDLPIVLAPMAGNSTPELVAAVSNAGGLGSYGCAMLSHEQLNEEARRMKALTYETAHKIEDFALDPMGRPNTFDMPRGDANGTEMSFQDKLDRLIAKLEKDLSVPAEVRGALQRATEEMIVSGPADRAILAAGKAALGLSQ